jgi:hypothetical protein
VATLVAGSALLVGYPFLAGGFFYPDVGLLQRVLMIAMGLGLGAKTHGYLAQAISRLWENRMVSKIQKLVPIDSQGVSEFGLFNHSALLQQVKTNPRGLVEKIYLLFGQKNRAPAPARSIEDLLTEAVLNNRGEKLTLVVREDSPDRAAAQLDSLRTLPIWDQVEAKGIRVDILLPGIDRAKGAVLLEHYAKGPVGLIFGEDLGNYSRAKDALLDGKSELDAPQIKVLIPQGGIQLPLALVKVLSDLQSSDDFRNKLWIYFLEDFLPGARATLLSNDIMEMKTITEALLSNA